MKSVHDKRLENVMNLWMLHEDDLRMTASFGLVLNGLMEIDGLFSFLRCAFC